MVIINFNEGGYLEDNYWSELNQMVDKKLVMKIFNPDLSLKEIDRNFVFKLVDEMIKWDKKVIKPGIQPNPNDIDVLLDIQDYFFYIISKAKADNIDSFIQLFTDILRRVLSKHKNPYYEGFFNALIQGLCVQKLKLPGENEWITFWMTRFQKSLLRLNFKID